MKDRINQDKWLLLAIKAAKAAGEKILDIYNQDFEVKFKKDKSPLTLADQKANEIIKSHLINSKIPILSEEGNQPEYEQRKNWDTLILPILNKSLLISSFPPGNPTLLSLKAYLVNNNQIKIIKIIDMGRPIFIHWKNEISILKLSWANPAKIRFGGVPIKVAIPPAEAL